MDRPKTAADPARYAYVGILAMEAAGSILSRCHGPGRAGNVIPSEVSRRKTRRNVRT